MWEVWLQAICFKLKLDAELTGGQVIIFSPKPLKDEDKHGLRKIVPPHIPVTFVNGVKKSTIDALRAMLSCELHAIDTKNLIIETDDDDFDIHAINQLLINDGWYDTWIINGLPYIKTNIVSFRKAQAAKKQRDTVITDDDMTNLKITLETCDNIDDFINQL